MTPTCHTARHGHLTHVPEAATHFDGTHYWRDDRNGWARWTGYDWQADRAPFCPARIVREVAG